MKRLLCATLPRPGHPAFLNETEATHAIQVLRLREGDTIEAMDGRGHSVMAHLRVKGGAPRLEVSEQDERSRQDSQPGAVVALTLEMAVLKGDAMEWVIEKAVELGVGQLIPVLTERTVVKVGGKGPEAFQERWRKIADQALKQCGRLQRMEVAAPVPLGQLLARPLANGERRLWCDEAARGEPDDLWSWLVSGHASAGAVRLVVGPEGGWSDGERALLATAGDRVSLGPIVLRAETAAIQGAGLIAAAFRAERRLDKGAAGKGS